MSAERIESFSSMLDNADERNMSPSVLNVQESNQAPPDESPSGPDCVNLFGQDAVQSEVGGFKSHVGVSQPASCVDTPFSRADVNKALFEARLQSLGDTELKYPWDAAEYLCLTDQLDSTTTASASQSASQKVAGRDLELPFC